MARGGGMCGEGGHAWPGGTCMAKGGMCGEEGHAWPGGMCGRERAWQERRPLQRTVRILLECILVTFSLQFFYSFIPGSFRVSLVIELDGGRVVRNFFGHSWQFYDK